MTRREWLTDRFVHDLLLDAWLQADHSYWLRRAAQLDKVGTPWADEAARACRNRASLCDPDHARELVALVLAEGDAP